MRVVLLLIVWVLLAPLAVGWADCACREPVKPELPPAHADAREMEKARQEVEQYVAGMKEYRECLAKCIRTSENDMSAVIEGWNHAVEEFNSRKR